ncbi:hypothetical protein P691DRAFT_831789 [Macrolepiota fuliginosa MF-IS2]|uniref:F-box domain-containing protein n=1 Tax=Macrolepiota fuliginosa MF-IS2 TaxID=1400762 RepID=A0A9P5XJX7_9AGAR|nr:hypothetical protein P691DRAFT_831789 [Macrolepiota fuliginosa MF-IS2]
MHPCLQVYDILEHICSELASSDSLDALAKLARTCTIFLDPALNALWDTIPTLEPLVRCLPQDAWAIRNGRYHSVLTLTRPTTLQDWERCKFYTHRIRHFGNIQPEDSLPGKIKGSIPTDKMIYTVLKHISFPPVLNNENVGPPLLTLPHIRTCRLAPHASSPAPHFTPFLSHTLRTLVVYATYDPEGVLPSLLSSLVYGAPFLKKLSISGVPDFLSYGARRSFAGDKGGGSIGERGWEAFNAVMMGMLHGLKHLESLECPGVEISDDVVRYLATRPMIRMLNIMNAPEVILNALGHGYEQMAPRYGWKEEVRGCFSYVEDLTLNCNSVGGFDGASRLLGCIGNTARIQKLELIQWRSSVSPEREVSTFVQKLLDLATTTALPALPLHTTSIAKLKTLVIRQSEMIAPQNRHSQLPQPMTLQALSPLLSASFQALETLIIELSTQFTFDDADAERMALAWPNLTELQLGHSYSNHEWTSGNSSMTLRGLKSFARNCPRLRSLGVSFNANAQDLTEPEQGGSGREMKSGKLGYSLRVLNVSESVYEGEPEDVAKCLLDIFPALERMLGSSLHVSPGWQEKWAQVSKLAVES